MTLKRLLSDAVRSSGPAIRLVKSRQRALQLCSAVCLFLAEARDKVSFSVVSVRKRDLCGRYLLSFLYSEFSPPACK